MAAAAPAGEAGSSEARSSFAELSQVELRAVEVLGDAKRMMETLVSSYHSMTGLTVDYMRVYEATIAHVTAELASTMDASKVFIRKCLEVDHEMEGIEAIATQARMVNHDLGRLELVVDRLCADESTPEACRAADGRADDVGGEEDETHAPGELSAGGYRYAMT